MGSGPTNCSAEAELAFLFRKERKSRPTLLLGAGASYRSGIPMAAETVKRIGRAAFARFKLGTDVRKYTPRPSDWMPFLEGQPWFIRDPVRLAENFPLAVEHLLTPREFRRDFLLDMIRPPNGINEGYRHLAALMMRGLCWTVLTPNFDRLLVEALEERRPQIHHVFEINRIPGDWIQFQVFQRNQVIYLHGAVELYTDKNLETETAHLNRRLCDLVRPLLNSSPLIVIGYRGAEPSIMIDLLADGIESSGGYRHGIYWCRLRSETPHPNVEKLGYSIGSNFRLLEIDGFDEIASRLASQLEEEDIYEVREKRSSDGVPASSDEEPLTECSLDDLDEALLLATLEKYCERLHRAPVTRDNYTALLAEQGLLRSIDGVPRPTLGCFLLFGRMVPERFPHACIAVTHDGKRRRLFSGNLLSQYQSLIEYLDSDEVNPTLRVKGRRTSEERRAFPSRAVTELVVNMLVHRDYSICEFAEVQVVAGESLSFQNAGGLPDTVYRKLIVDEEGAFRPIRSITEIRNPCLADVFFGLGPMDKAGTGLVDVDKLATENGGAATFGVGKENRHFSAILRQPIQAAPNKSKLAFPILLLAYTQLTY